MIVARHSLILFFILCGSNLVNAQPGNDICSAAIDIQEFINQGQELAGPFTNVGATGNDLDIGGVTGCWLDDLTGYADGSSPQVDATVWFRFNGYDGELMLFVQPCDSNLNFLSQDTQMALYRGECDTLNLVVCNEDINPSAGIYWSGITTQIEQGETYYLAIDGFNYSGFGSPELPMTTGEFCFSSQEPSLQVEPLLVSPISVYPNPSDGILSIRSAQPVMRISVTDIAGKACNSASNVLSSETTQVYLPDQPGIYMVYIQTLSGSETHRVVRK